MPMRLPRPPFAYYVSVEHLLRVSVYIPEALKTQQLTVVPREYTPEAESVGQWADKTTEVFPTTQFVEEAGTQGLSLIVRTVPNLLDIFTSVKMLLPASVSHFPKFWGIGE